MTEPRTREIQLTAKQLVFIFMSTLLVAVVVFLLGVWVGRGIGVDQVEPTMQASGGTLVDLDKGKDKSKSADGKVEKYDYPSALQGTPPAGGATQPPAPVQPPVQEPAPPPKPNPPPAETKPAPQPASKPAASDESWYVQVGAFSSKANAERQAASLKAKGYNTIVLPGSSFRVRVGPFPQKAAAQEALARLSKEPGVVKPSVTGSR